jgi:PAS domain S-box-containing protein
MHYSQALITALGDVIYERCLDSGKVTWQGDFTGILGFQPEHMGTDNLIWLERIYPEDKTRVLTAIEVACDKLEAYDIEYRFRHNDGTYIWIQDRGLPHYVEQESGKPRIKVVGVMRDISDRKQAELDMEKALLRERELNQLKTRFIDLASHEFRTPLTSILGFTELLEQYSHKFNPEVHRKHLQRIKNAAQRLQELVDDVLSISRVDAGSMALDVAPLDVQHLCNDIFQELKAAFGEGNELRLFLDDKLAGDRPKVLPVLDGRVMRHILTNLLSNALKYSFTGEAVDLTVACTSQNITFTVNDRGIGIPKEDLGHLFEPFHRATNVGKIPGTGLGLHIVERYVELHNGTIMVTSIVNSGTTCRICFPCIFVDNF